MIRELLKFCIPSLAEHQDVFRYLMEYVNEFDAYSSYNQVIKELNLGSTLSNLWSIQDSTINPLFNENIFETVPEYFWRSRGIIYHTDAESSLPSEQRYEMVLSVKRFLTPFRGIVYLTDSTKGYMIIIKEEKMRFDYYRVHNRRIIPLRSERIHMKCFDGFEHIWCENI